PPSPTRRSSALGGPRGSIAHDDPELVRRDRCARGPVGGDGRRSAREDPLPRALLAGPERAEVGADRAHAYANVRHDDGCGERGEHLLERSEPTARGAIRLWARLHRGIDRARSEETTS